MVEMSRPSVQYGIAGVTAPLEGPLLWDGGQRRFDIALLVETALALIVAVSAIKTFGASSALGSSWLISPGILIVAALVPTAIRRGSFQALGFNVRHPADSLVVLAWTCAVAFPLAFCGLWLLGFFGFDLFSRPALLMGNGWIYWLLYQFIYIAVAEEVFFRGYLQSNILRLTKAVMGERPRRQQWTSIGISAACFALAHVIVQGRITSALTFLPGLVLGWLFIRTKSLLAPILFHGLANACYLVMLAALG
jgi:membrane protease YdiL (CAAX protease family)